MTYNEFILYRQEYYYFAKDNGLPIYSKDDLNLLVARNLSRIKRKDLDLLYLNDSIIGGEI